MPTPTDESFMEIAVQAGGQITIPPGVCAQFGIREGTLIRMLVEGNPPRIVLAPITREYIHAFHGILKHTTEGDALQRRRKEETYHGRRQPKGGRRGSRRSR